MFVAGGSGFEGGDIAVRRHARSLAGWAARNAAHDDEATSGTQPEGVAHCRRPAAADRTLVFRRLPGNMHRRFRVNSVLLLAEEVIVAALYESLPTGREYRPGPRSDSVAA